MGHAYLFTGARGAGKTSAARILAKALNCVHGPTPRPATSATSARASAPATTSTCWRSTEPATAASTRFASLRQNVNIRPSRARFKIYIIDEVHMLTREAFNALLKTLEEPPEHVKFIFCTTEPDKIPITILSRCQRFDFAGIQMRQIVERLAQIAKAEGAAGRARGAGAAGAPRRRLDARQPVAARSNCCRSASKRSRSPTSTPCSARPARRGCRRSSAIWSSATAAAALADLDAAVREGVDVGQLLDQLLGYFRDLMVTLAGCPPETLLYSSADEHAGLLELARQLGMETILAMMQILDQTIARLRYSTHARTLAEMALVRICTLADLQAIPALIAALRSSDVDRPMAGAQIARTAANTPSTPCCATKKKSERAKCSARRRCASGLAANSADAAVATRVVENAEPLVAELAFVAL